MDEEYRKKNFGKFGCCIACNERGTCSHPCYSCICSKCDWYVDSLYSYSLGKKIFNQKCYYLNLKKEYIECPDIVIEKETEKAYFLNDGEKTAWIPKKLTRFRNGNIAIADWLLDEHFPYDDGVFELDGLHYKEYEEKFLPKIKYHTRALEGE
jgi:hypothetical protein